MTPHAILFGNLDSLAEVGVLHRQAVNAALMEAREPEVSLPDYAAHADPDMGPWLSDAYGTGLAERAAELFHDRLAQVGLTPRPGVAEVIAAADAAGVRLGLVSSAPRADVEAALSAFGSALMIGRFAYVGTSESGAPKPAPMPYARALDALGLAPTDAVAIEPSPVAAASSVAVGIPTVAFPAQPWRGAAFEGVSQIADRLSAQMLGLGQPV